MPTGSASRLTNEEAALNYRGCLHRCSYRNSPSCTRLSAGCGDPQKLSRYKYWAFESAVGGGYPGLQGVHRRNRFFYAVEKSWPCRRTNGMEAGECGRVGNTSSVLPTARYLRLRKDCG